MHTFAEANLEIDETELSRERDATQQPEIIDDQDLRLLLRRNRIALAKGTATSVHDDSGQVGGYDIPLTCIVHAHPECRFQWARLIVDLTPTPQAQIRDMAPRKVIDDHPVELTTTVGAGLRFDVAAKTLGGELRSEYQSSRTVYFPEIISSGIGFTRGYWDFLARGDRTLHVDRELRLLIAAPPQHAINARFQLRARVKLAGIGSIIPLLARGGTIDGIHQIGV